MAVNGEIRLATANRSRISTRVTKQFGHGRGVVNRVKKFLHI